MSRLARSSTGLSTALLSLAMSTGAASAEAPPNVLIVVADDLGVDRVASYGWRNEQGGAVSGPTPTIDRLAARGVLFRNAWSNPVCSPTRATCLTGLYGFRTGIGRWIRQERCPPTEYGLSTDLIALPEVLPEGYRRPALGKWHLASCRREPESLLHPVATGFELHAGSLANIRVADGHSYFDWLKVSSRAGGPSSEERITVYATTDTTDDAIRVISSFGDEPWVLWLAYNAPHGPAHEPPLELFTGGPIEGTPAENPFPHFKAMVEALDTELGRLFDSIPDEVMERTTIVFFGDNGTRGDFIEAPFDPTHGKGTLYNGGVNVPLIVAGPAVDADARGTESDALVNATDLFASVVELTGGDARSAVDSVSFVPYLADPSRASIREHAFAEIFDPNFAPPGSPRNHGVAIRGARYKLIRRADGTDELYDVIADYHEQDDRLAGGADELSADERAAYAGLARALAELLGG